MHSPSFARYAELLDRNDWQGVAELMLDSAHRLARTGADFLICPDNTIHQALPDVERRSPLPWLHIADVVVAEAAAHGYRRLGITGTRWLVESVACLRESVASLKENGCDAVILGCTELPLVLDDSNAPLPTLDSTRLLARAALRFAVEGAQPPSRSTIAR